MAAIAADRSLLFGLLALQNGLIDQVQLVAAFQAWTRDKTRSLADQLVARGDLDAAACAGLEAGDSVGVEVAAGGEVLGRGPGLVASPGLEGGDELALVD